MVIGIFTGCGESYYVSFVLKELLCQINNPLQLLWYWSHVLCGWWGWYLTYEDLALAWAISHICVAGVAISHIRVAGMGVAVDARVLYFGYSATKRRFPCVQRWLYPIYGWWAYTPYMCGWCGYIPYTIWNCVGDGWTLHTKHIQQLEVRTSEESFIGYN